MTGVLIGALDIGGTHVTAGRVAIATRRVDPGSLTRLALDPDGSRAELLGTIREAALRADAPGIERWGVAVPGPFDYARGRSAIRGVRKLDALYGVDLRGDLAAALRLTPPERVRFINDAQAFLLGEWWAGAARGHGVAMGVTLGTGLGSAFLREGRIVSSGPDVPPDGRLDLMPLGGGAAEDVLSRRGLLASYRRAGVAGEVIDLAARAREGEPAAVATFERFGRDLAGFLLPWLERFAPTALVVGGSIARAWDLFEAGFDRARSTRPALTLRVAERLDEAPLLGAAYDAMGYARPGAGPG